MFLMFIVMCIIIIWAIRWAVKQERINEANEQADMERRRGEEILRARAERAAKERWETSEKARQATQNGERFKVAGTSFREDALMSFAHKNPDYDMTTREIIEDGETNARIYRYDFDPVIATLEPEPDNPHDPKAIKVLFNGVHIGYIKAGSCNTIHKLLREDNIAAIYGRVYGGPYKIVVIDEDDEDEEPELECDTYPIAADIRIARKQNP